MSKSVKVGHKAYGEHPLTRSSHLTLPRSLSIALSPLSHLSSAQARIEPRRVRSDITTRSGFFGFKLVVIFALITILYTR